MPDLAQLMDKMSDPLFVFTLVEFLAATALWVYHLIKKTDRRRLWFVITVITLLIFLGALESPHFGKQQGN